MFVVRRTAQQEKNPGQAGKGDLYTSVLASVLFVMSLY